MVHLCIKNLVMDTGGIAFYEGKEYETVCDYKYLLTNEMNLQHSVSDYEDFKFEDYFVTVEDTDKSQKQAKKEE